MERSKTKDSLWQRKEAACGSPAPTPACLQGADLGTLASSYGLKAHEAAITLKLSNTASGQGLHGRPRYAAKGNCVLS